MAENPNPEIRIDEINNAIAHYADQRYPQGKDPKDCLADLQTKLQVFKIHAQRLGATRAFELFSIYRMADRIVEKRLSNKGEPDDPITVNLHRAAARLAQHRNILVVSDMDGTITEGAVVNGVYTPGTAYMNLIPGRLLADKLEGQGFTKEEIMILAYYYPLTQYPHIMRAGAEHVRIRPGLEEFIEHLIGSGGCFEVLSANFQPFVDGVLDKINRRADIRKVTSVRDDNISSIAKAQHLHIASAENPDSLLVFVCDGRSDIEALEAYDVVGWWYALKDQVFHHALQEKDVIHFPYQTFHDITKNEKQIFDLSLDYRELTQSDIAQL